MRVKNEEDSGLDFEATGSAGEMFWAKKAEKLEEEIKYLKLKNRKLEGNSYTEKELNGLINYIERSMKLYTSRIEAVLRPHSEEAADAVKSASDECIRSLLEEMERIEDGDQSGRGRYGPKSNTSGVVARRNKKLEDEEEEGI
jgi:hypothetical protein